MDRLWIALPLAATAAAQTPAVSPAERALRARAEEFFRLQVEKKYRQAENLVASDAKDDYAGANKPRLEGFKIKSVEFPDKGRALVTITAKTTVLMMGAGAQKFEVPSVSSWKLDHGKWCWYLDPQLYSQTPFGTAKVKTDSNTDPADAFRQLSAEAPKLADITNGVKPDKTEVVLVPGGPAEAVSFSNSLGGTARVKVVERSTPVPGLRTNASVLEIPAGSKAALEFTADAGSSFEAYVDVTVEPLARNFTIHVKTKK